MKIRDILSTHKSGPSLPADSSVWMVALICSDNTQLIVKGTENRPSTQTMYRDTIDKINRMFEVNRANLAAKERWIADRGLGNPGIPQPMHIMPEREASALFKKCAEAIIKEMGSFRNANNDDRAVIFRVGKDRVIIAVPQKKFNISMRVVNPHGCSPFIRIKDDMTCGGYAKKTAVNIGATKSKTGSVTVRCLNTKHKREHAGYQFFYIHNFCKCDCSQNKKESAKSNRPVADSAD